MSTLQIAEKERKYLKILHYSRVRRKGERDKDGWETEGRGGRKGLAITLTIKLQTRCVSARKEILIVISQ